MATAGVVCEGHSDFAILERVLIKLWPELDEILLLQPILDSLQRAQGASGSSGVKEWCERNANKLSAVIDSGVGPKLDLLLIALDADAAISAGIEQPPKNASAYDASRLCKVIRGWLGKPLPSQLVITIPAMAIEAWVVAAYFKTPAKPETLENPATTLVTKGRLEFEKRPKRQRKVVKPPATYRTFAEQVAGKWPRVRRVCAEAARMEQKIGALRSRTD
jgi:hypothetical protein